MKTLSDTVIETILSTTTSKEVLGLLESINADIRWKKELYYRAHQKPEIETIEVLLQEQVIVQVFVQVLVASTWKFQGDGKELILVYTHCYQFLYTTWLQMEAQ